MIPGTVLLSGVVGSTGRAVNAPHLVALVRAGARFERGKLIERARQDAA